MPADAPVYVEAVVRPDGEQGDNVSELLDRFLTDTSLEELIDKELAEDKQTYAEDIEPWLGASAGFTVSDFAADEPSFMGALQVTDADAARDALTDVKEIGTRGDVSIFQDDDDEMFGAVTDEFLLFASTREQVEAAIDRSESDSLASSERFEGAVDDLPEERLGAVYLDTAVFGELIAADPSLDPAARGILDKVFGEDAAPITAALTAQPNALTIESRLAKSALAGFGAFGTGAAPDLVKDAPAGTFAVLGATDVGETLKSTIDLFAGALGGAAITGQLEAQTGINLDRDVLSWIGDISLFVRGETVQSLDGALVIEVTDPAAAAAGVERLVAAAKRTDTVSPAQVDGADKAFSLPIPGFPLPLVLAYNSERAALAVGEQAAADALNPTETIEDSGLYERAESAVDGIAPAAIVDFAAVLSLAEAAGATGDSDYQEAKPYLDQLDLLATGGEEDGDELRSLFTVSVKEGG